MDNNPSDEVNKTQDEPITREIHHYQEENQSENQSPSFREKLKQKWENLKNRIREKFAENPKLKLIVPITALLILAIISASWAAVKRYSSDAEEGSQPFLKIVKEKLKAQEIESKLDGTMSDLQTANRHPLAIMVENHPDARPHYGLDQASIIYEAIAEGGITRFMAVYGPRGADKIGPVRSARIYYLDWVLEYDGFFAHVGGNADALDLIPQIGVKDLDQFALGKKAYWREARGTASEHTMYTDSDKLWEQARLKDWDITSADYTPWKFKKEKPKIKKASAPNNTDDNETNDDINNDASDLDGETQTVTVDFSSLTYQVKWVYDEENNSYLRFLAGSPHKDGKTDKQLEAKNIVIQEVTRKPTTTRIGENGWIFGTIGEGKATVIQDGKAIKGTWKKQDRKSRTLFYDENSQEIQFNPGPTWIEIIHPDTNIELKK